MDKKSLKETFHIWKRGHLNKLVVGIKKLQYPHEGMKQYETMVRCLQETDSSSLKLFSEICIPKHVDSVTELVER